MILQQLMFTPKPRSVSDLSRFSNRDDISNIQYSLRKLTAAGLIEKVPGSTNRDTRYRPTAAGRELTEILVATRRELLIAPSVEHLRHRGAAQSSHHCDVTAHRPVRSRVAGAGGTR